MAFIAPLSSATVASTSGRIPRRRTDREVMLLTWTTTVALSPGTSSATARASRRSRGRCSSRSSTVASPSVSAARCILAPSNDSSALNLDGRGYRTEAASSSDGSSGSEVPNAVAAIADQMMTARPDLLMRRAPAEAINLSRKRTT